MRDIEKKILNDDYKHMKKCNHGKNQQDKYTVSPFYGTVNVL